MKFFIDTAVLDEIQEAADMGVLSADYLTVPEAEIAGIESVLTITAGEIVHGAEEFAGLAADLPAVSPDWSPVAAFGGYATE